MRDFCPVNRGQIIHKLRNLKKYVPDKLRGTLHWRMKKLLNIVSFDDAMAELQSFAHWLSEVSQGAVDSLEEAGSELLTLHLLGVGGRLQESLSTTNMIEVLIEKVRTTMHRIKRGRSSPTHALRWSASAARLAQKSFRPIQGCNAQALILISALSKFKLEKLAA